ncbi:unnamed protein product, partial [Polarella glacialis]
APSLAPAPAPAEPEPAAAPVRGLSGMFSTGAPPEPSGPFSFGGGGLGMEKPADAMSEGYTLSEGLSNWK